MTVLKIKRLAHNVNVPKSQTEGAAGMDLCAAISEPIELKPLERKFKEKINQYLTRVKELRLK